jgi:creatinine amidohydrolase/Fe(II)-dependent formamide hydrolase-like protein
MHSITIKPIGSTECHGHRVIDEVQTTEPLLPPETDAYLARVYARMLGEAIFHAGIKVNILDTETIGMSEEHKLCNAEPCHTLYQTSEKYMPRMRRQFDEIAEDDPETFIIGLNAHGGNRLSLGVVENEFNYNHVTSKLFIPDVYSSRMSKKAKRLFRGNGSGHAGPDEANVLVAEGIVNDLTTHRNPGYVRRFKKDTFRSWPTHVFHRLGVVMDTPNYVINAKKGARYRDFVAKEIARESLRTFHKRNTEIREVQEKSTGR